MTRSQVAPTTVIASNITRNTSRGTRRQRSWQHTSLACIGITRLHRLHSPASASIVCFVIVLLHRHHSSAHRSSASASFVDITFTRLQYLLRLHSHALQESTYSAQLRTRNHVSTFNALSLTLSGMFDRGGGVGRLLWPSVTTLAIGHHRPSHVSTFRSSLHLYLECI